jgi:hypothetical protein
MKNEPFSKEKIRPTAPSRAPRSAMMGSRSWGWEYRPNIASAQHMAAASESLMVSPRGVSPPGVPEPPVVASVIAMRHLEGPLSAARTPGATNAWVPGLTLASVYSNLISKFAKWSVYAYTITAKGRAALVDAKGKARKLFGELFEGDPRT